MMPQNDRIGYLQTHFFLSQPVEKWQGNCYDALMPAGRPTPAINNDSLKNCLISCFLSEPTALRTPTSFALFSERAVLRFMKLMQAISNTTSPRMPNIRTYFIKPPVFFPFFKITIQSPFCHRMNEHFRFDGLQCVLIRKMRQSLHSLIFVFTRISDWHCHSIAHKSAMSYSPSLFYDTV